MSLSLVPSSLFKRPSRSFFNFPNLWEELETGLKNINEEQGLTIYEEKNNIVVEAALPGLKEDEIEVNLNRGVLWIKGERNEEEHDKNRKFYRKSTNTFSYRVTLPEQIDEKQEPQASYNQGVLKITFQKAKQAESKRIAIKKGK